MSLQEYKNFIWCGRHTMIDMAMMGDFDESDKVGLAEFIEDMSDDNFVLLFECVASLDEMEGSKLIKIWYHNKLRENRVEFSLVSESEWSNNRDIILMEEVSDKDQDDLNNQVLRTIQTASIASAVALLVGQLKTPDGIEKVRGVLDYLKIHSKDAYGTLSQIPVINKIVTLPAKAADRAAKIGKSFLPPDVVPKAGETLVQAKERLKQGRGYSSLLWIEKNWKRVSRKVAVAAAGIGAITFVGYQIYKLYLAPSAKACKGKKGNQKQICVLKFKINAADKAIEALKQGIEGCKERFDPQKCKYSIQQKIWHWTRRKQRYQKKLIKLSKTKSPAEKVFRAKKSRI